MIGSDFQNYLVSALIGYLVGSFPTAYILVKLNSNVDIRQVGSGNIGARNALEVSGSKFVGFIVLLIDVLKGAGAVVLSMVVFGNDFWIVALGGTGAILGHNFSPWMKFKGGKGLATTAGVMILLGWIYVAIWLLIYFLLQRFLKQIHISSVVTSIVAPFLILLVPKSFIDGTGVFQFKLSEVFWMSLISSIMILIRHIEPMKELIHLKNKVSR